MYTADNILMYIQFLLDHSFTHFEFFRDRCFPILPELKQEKKRTSDSRPGTGCPGSIICCKRHGRIAKGDPSENGGSHAVILTAFRGSRSCL